MRLLLFFVLMSSACFAADATVIFKSGEIKNNCIVDEAATGYWINFDGKRYWYKKDQVTSVTFNEKVTLTEKQRADIAKADADKVNALMQDSAKKVKSEQEQKTAIQAYADAKARYLRDLPLIIEAEKKERERRKETESEILAAQRELAVATREAAAQDRIDRIEKAAAADAAAAQQQAILALARLAALARNQGQMTQQQRDAYQYANDQASAAQQNAAVAQQVAALAQQNAAQARALALIPEPVNITLSELLIGGSIVGDDGAFLGTISTNTSEPKSIANKFGNYGSDFSITSVFNKFSNYGNPFSATSCTNEFSVKPPKLYDKNAKLLGYLTNNKSKTPGIDLSALTAIINSK